MLAVTERGVVTVGVRNAPFYVCSGQEHVMMLQLVSFPGEGDILVGEDPASSLHPGPLQTWGSLR